MPKPKPARQSRRHTVESNTYRFFVDAEAFQGRQVVIEDSDLIHQFTSVLRLRGGEQVLLLDNSGWQYVVQLDSLERNRVIGTVERKQLAEGEPRTKLTLYVALVRSERFEWILQKGTEIGVSAIVPLICERSTIADADELSERKQERWRRIVREAAEQSRRGKLPRLAPPVFFPTACDQAVRRGQALLLWEGTGVAPLRQVLQRTVLRSASTPLDEAPDQPSSTAQASPFSIALFSGPEGGFTNSEFETAVHYGMIAVTLGPRTLRAETAPLVAATAILYEMGDLD
jgi:16S rRNA (uracil1498-N3)-methyltransferase